MSGGTDIGGIRARVAIGVAVLAGATTTVAIAGESGAIDQPEATKGCYTIDGASGAGAGTCRNVRGTVGPSTVLLSPDERFAYVTGYGENVVESPPVLSVLRRNRRSGVLRPVAGKRGCYSRTGANEDGPGECKNVRALDTGDATSLAISRDGRFLYAAGQDGSEDAAGVTIFSRNKKNGKLRQLAGKKGCVSPDGASEAGAGTCKRGRSVDAVASVYLTPDQDYLYAGNYTSDADSGIAVFRRSGKTGKLRQLKGKNGCISKDGTTEASEDEVVCRAMANIANPWDMAMPDNRFVYVNAAYEPDLVQAFKRNRKGGLVPLKGTRSCVSNDGTSPAHDCVDGRGLDNVERVILSKNERFLYAGSYSAPAPIAVLDRNPRTGLLSQRDGTAACISADGSSGGEADECREGRGLDGTYAGTLTPDGRALYFTQFNVNALVAFRVNPSTGAFSQLPGDAGCVSADDIPDCGDARALEGPYQVTTGRNGRHVYVAAYEANGVAFFDAVP
jgi:hypothetical protein